MRHLLIILLLPLSLTAGLLGAATSRPAALPGKQDPKYIESLLQKLGDPDPRVRKDAGGSLLNLGEPARPFLVKAARSPLPQIASAAGEVLMGLPWFSASDPADVQEALKEFGKLDNGGRISLIEERLAPIAGSEPALLRITRDDPSDEVSWFAAGVLRKLEDAGITKTLREMDLGDARVQILALAGRAFLPVDRARAMSLFRRAVEMDEEADSSDEGKLEFAYRLLVTDAIESGKTEEAMEILRTRAKREAVQNDASTSVFALLAMYADHLNRDTRPGAALWAAVGREKLNADLDRFGEYLGRPAIMHALSRIERSSPTGSNMIADVLARCAVAGSLSAESHVRVARFCVERAWDEDLRIELTAVLAEPNPGDNQQLVLNQLAANMMLARSAEMNDDHGAVVEHLEKVLDAVEKYGSAYAFALRLDPADLKSQAMWNRLQAARESERSAAEQALNQLLDLPAPESDTGIAVVNELRKRKQSTDAKAYFQKAYETQSARLSIRTNAAEAMNNLAWLCARCEEHPEQAIDLAERAVAMEPENYAYIDTAASAYFAAGNAKEAARLERRALILRPNDAFMLRQLEMFEAGAAKK